MQSRNRDRCIDLRGRAPVPEIGAHLVKMRVYPVLPGSRNIVAISDGTAF